MNNIFRIIKNLDGRKWVIIFSLLTVIAALTATQLFIKTDTKGVSGWLQTFYVQALIWYVWGFITPFIFFLGQKLPIAGKHWYLYIIAHLPISALLVLGYLALYVTVFMGLSGTPFNRATFDQIYFALFTNLFHWYLILYWIIIGIGRYFDFYKNYKARELSNLQLESQLVQSQLKNLKMQLHPHFLFNTLNTISSLVRHEEKKEAVKMLAGLSDLLRVSLLDIGKQEVTLKDELSLLNIYLDIEKTRFKDKLEIELEVDEVLYDAKVPNLLLQPIVENAIRHGLSKQVSAKRLSIKGSRVNSGMLLKVENEGPHLPKNWSIEDIKGIGLTNTVERIRQLYGESGAIRLNNVESGVSVEIQLPLHLNGQNNDE
ncbi:MAG: histidine kinase [Bacteroidota bacterium]